MNQNAALRPALVELMGTCLREVLAHALPQPCMLPHRGPMPATRPSLAAVLSVLGLAGFSLSSFAEEPGFSDTSPSPDVSPSGVRYWTADTRPWDIQMCEDAKVIVIGRVESKVYGPATYRADVTFRSPDRMTTATILVDGMIAGDPRDVIELRYRGDDTQTWSLSPDLTVGKTYLFFMLERETPYELGSNIKVISYNGFPTYIDLLPDSVLRASWDEHCQSGQSLGGRPPDALIPLVNDQMRTPLRRR